MADRPAPRPAARFGILLGVALTLALLASPARARTDGAGAFPDTIAARTPGGTRSLALTGTAVRTRFFSDVYVVASYVDARAGVETADGLLQTPAARRLELLMLRGLDGSRMAEAMRESLERRDPTGRHAAAIDRLDRYIRGRSVSAGDRIRFDAGAGAPFTCTISGRDSIAIEDEGFAHTVWSIYLGPDPLTDAIKRGLTSRLRATPERRSSGMVRPRRAR